MEFKELINKINGKRNGTFFNITFKSDLSSKLSAESKRNGVKCYKLVSMTTRKGIDYDKQKSVQDKVANGKVLTHELPWGQWKKGFEGIIVEHNGVDYLRLYPATNQRKVSYFLNGKEVLKDDLKGYMIKSFFTPKKESVDAFNVKVSGVVAIR